jgi:hypothetical protein
MAASGFARQEAHVFMRGKRMVVGVALMVGFVAAPLMSMAADRDAGESPKYLALKNRAMAPKLADIDKSVTLDALLAKDDPDAFTPSKGATIVGTVVQVEREPDGAMHLVLANDRHKTDTSKWVIAEVTPSWQKRKASLTPKRLRALVGRSVRVTGWLFYEPDTDSPDPRGTRWELHPVTALTALEAAR